MKNDKDESVRAIAAEALASVANDDDLMVEALAIYLHDRSFRVRYAVVSALASYGIRAKSTSKPILSLIDFPDADQSIETFDVLEALKKIIPTENDELPVLLKLLRSRNADVKCQTLEVLAAIGITQKEGLEAVSQCLNDKDPKVRNAAKQLLDAANKNK